MSSVMTAREIGGVAVPDVPTRLFIGGEWRDAADGATFEVIAPGVRAAPRRRRGGLGGGRRRRGARGARAGRRRRVGADDAAPTAACCCSASPT